MSNRESHDSDQENAPDVFPSAEAWLPRAGPYRICLTTITNRLKKER